MRLAPLATIVVASAVAVASAPAQVAVAPAKTTVLSIQPLAAMFSVYSVEAEHATAPTITLGLGASYWSFGDLRYASGDFKVRYYPEARPFQGFSFGGQLGYTSVSDVQSDPFGTGQSTRTTTGGPTFGVALDYGWLLGQSRSFYVGLGLGAKKILAKDNGSGDLALAYPTARISVGYAF